MSSEPNIPIILTTKYEYRVLGDVLHDGPYRPRLPEGSPLESIHRDLGTRFEMVTRTAPGPRGKWREGILFAVYDDELALLQMAAERIVDERAAVHKLYHRVTGRTGAAKEILKNITPVVEA